MKIIIFVTFIIVYITACNGQVDVLNNDYDNSKIYYNEELRDNTQSLSAKNPESIQPYVYNAKYWQYKDSPILLLGASDADNLFNHIDIWPFGLESHLDLLVKNGGNYVRNTMSSRDHRNLWPYELIEEGLYDLNIWNREYWNRFEDFLRMTYDRDIIVQIEVWDRFDFVRKPWNLNPFNPKNNINYNKKQSGLKEKIDTHPNKRENNFFRTIPDLENNQILLDYQKSFVKKLLSISLKYPNVLYCISNETNESTLWSDYWAYFIHNIASEQKKLVHITEMRDEWDLSDPKHAAVYNKPDLYTFVEFSQNNHQQGQTHWDNAQRVWKQSMEKYPRPMNSVKIYGGMRHGGGFEEGAQKLWRNIFGGFASSRFHRTGNTFNPAGIGLSPLAQTQIRSMRMLTDEMNVFACNPSNHLLSNRGQNEAYAFAEPDQQYAVYFPNGGSVKIDLSDTSGDFSMRWLKIMVSEWQEETFVEGGDLIELSPPNEGPWAVLIRRE